MKWATMLGALGASLISVLACAGVGDLTISPSPLDMGVLIANTKASGVVLITNSGSSPISLDATVRTDCGCTNAKLSTTMVKPGESTLMSFTLNTKGMDGPFRKSLFVRDAKTGEEIEATIAGRALPAITQSGPLLLQADTLDATTATASCRVVVRRKDIAEAGPASVRSMTSEHPAVSVVWSKVDEDEWTTTYEVHAMLEVEKLQGPGGIKRSVAIKVAFEDDAKPELSFPALLDITSGLRPMPDGARFSTQDLRTTTQRRTIRLVPTAGKQVTVRSARALSGRKISVELRNDDSGSSLLVTLPRDELASGSAHVVDYIDVLFEHAGKERSMRIPVASY